MPPESLFLAFCLSALLRLMEGMRSVAYDVVEDEVFVFWRIAYCERVGLVLSEDCEGALHDSLFFFLPRSIRHVSTNYAQ